ncbi:hypothetical protein ACEWY4_027495 [Coilia grayii]|uniref:Maturase n=1 Tax=Coilia grayii TaxID=363190 RepID=A0ABD1ITP0_9TELE
MALGTRVADLLRLFAIRRQICGVRYPLERQIAIQALAGLFVLHSGYQVPDSDVQEMALGTRVADLLRLFAIRRQICGGPIPPRKADRHTGTGRLGLFVLHSGYQVPDSDVQEMALGTRVADLLRLFAIRRQICGGPIPPRKADRHTGTGRFVCPPFGYQVPDSDVQEMALGTRVADLLRLFAIRRQICWGPIPPRKGRSPYRHWPVRLGVCKDPPRFVCPPFGVIRFRIPMSQEMALGTRVADLLRLFAIRRQICGGPIPPRKADRHTGTGRFRIPMSQEMALGTRVADLLRLFAIRRQICGVRYPLERQIAIQALAGLFVLHSGYQVPDSDVQEMALGTRVADLLRLFAIRRQICGGPIPPRKADRHTGTGRLGLFVLHSGYQVPDSDVQEMALGTRVADLLRLFAIRRQICGGPIPPRKADRHTGTGRLGLFVLHSGYQVPDSDVQEMALGTRVADLLRLFAIRRQICGGPIPPRKADRHTGTGRLGLFVLHSGYQVPDSDVQEMALGTRVADLLRLFAIRRQICGGPIPPRKADRHTGTGRLGLFVLHSGYQVPDSDVQEMALGTRVADLLRLFAIRRQIRSVGVRYPLERQIAIQALAGSGFRCPRDGFGYQGGRSVETLCHQTADLWGSDTP